MKVTQSIPAESEGDAATTVSSCDLASLHQDLLDRIFASKAMRPLDLMNCEQTCKRWRCTLRTCQPTGNRGSWASKLKLVFIHDIPEIIDKPRQLSWRHVCTMPEIRVMTENKDPCDDADHTLTDWLARKVHGIKTLILTLQGQLDWQAVEALRIVHHSSNLSPPAPYVKVIAGAELFVQASDCCSILTDLKHLELAYNVDPAEGKASASLVSIGRMTNLRSLSNQQYQNSLIPYIYLGDALSHLSSLQHLGSLELSLCKNIFLQLDALQGLQQLRLSRCLDSTVDISSCTQITLLAMAWLDEQPSSILLPKGPSVSLQHFAVSAVNDADYFNRLDNLADATKLTYLEFFKTFPWQMEWNWPAAMPSLAVLKLHHFSGPLPAILSTYTCLQHLQLTSADLVSAHPTVPICFSHLSNLKSLVLNDNSFTEFPVSIMHLKQLKTLDLSSSLRRVTLPVDIFGFS